MAKIKDATPQTSSGGYKRLVSNEQMADIFTKAQSTVITNGTELEKIISSQAVTISDLDSFIEEVKNGTMPNGTYLCTKKVVNASQYKIDKHEPDFIVFVVDRNKLCDIVELKDGDSFDTKKSKSELDSLQKFTNHIAPKIPFMVKYYICSFNQSDKDKIVVGFKNCFTKEEVMTGREFCDLLGINYDNIVNTREQDAIENFHYVVQEMVKISEVREAVKSNNRQHIAETEFYNEEEE